MKDYEKPILVHNDEAFEGVYAASGAVAGADCFKVTARITQRPETGRENYCVKVDAVHNAADRHHSSEQVLTLSFNQPVTYVSCNDSNATLSGGNGTNALSITFNYHQNGGPENIGLADIYVESVGGLEVLGAVLTCDHKCAYNHSW